MLVVSCVSICAQPGKRQNEPRGAPNNRVNNYFYISPRQMEWIVESLEVEGEKHVEELGKLTYIS